MNYPFQFGTVFTLMSVQTSRTLGNENLFYAIFGSLMDLISGNRFKPPGSDSISRMKTGKRKISAPLAKKCRLYSV